MKEITSQHVETEFWALVSWVENCREASVACPDPLGEIALVTLGGRDIAAALRRLKQEADRVAVFERAWEKLRAWLEEPETVGQLTGYGSAGAGMLASLMRQSMDELDPREGGPGPP